VSIVTPEAVRLEFAPAGVATRMLGLLIDLAIQLGALLALGLVVGLTTSGGVSETAAVILTLVGLFVIILGYPVACETLWNGRTVGKAALGLRVRTKEGAPIRFRHAAIRGALGLVDFWFTLGAAATMTSTAFAFYPPPGWEAYAAALDVGAMTADQYGLVRGYLLRASEMTPAARHHLALRLANPLTAILAHRPPEGVQAEPFLHCAAAAYQRLHRAPELTPPH
jgi:uncharacterized RDD family membrane protein YckC